MVEFIAINNIFEIANAPMKRLTLNFSGTQKEATITEPKMVSIDDMGRMTDSDKLTYLICEYNIRCVYIFNIKTFKLNVKALQQHSIKNQCKLLVAMQARATTPSQSSGELLEDVLRMKAIFPIKTEEQFATFNRFIREKKDFKKKIVSRNIIHTELF